MKTVEHCFILRIVHVSLLYIYDINYYFAVGKEDIIYNIAVNTNLLTVYTNVHKLLCGTTSFRLFIYFLF